MSTTTNRAPTQAAPWKKTFLDHLSKMDAPEFVLSTLAVAPPNSPTPYVPRARYCIFRGLWAELPENKHNEAPLNPRVFESEMPTLTTDVRMEKVSQMFASSAGHADRDELVQGSGGGGPVEAVWWVKNEGIMTQWRIKGQAFIIGPDIEDDTESSGVRTVKSALGSRMRCVESGKEGDWSWKKERDSHFGNNSPGIRGMLNDGQNT
jgi:pyridoxamine 5'-phosphate oxidase